jgi:hypothetical protein
LPEQCTGNYNCTDWSGIGAFIGQFSYQHMYNAMGPGTLKLPHGRFQHFAPYDEWTEALFPYDSLLQYDKTEVAAGRPSLFASATYQGVKRPVLWTMYDIGGIYDQYPARPVNLKDERFIQFWVNRYVKPWLQRINQPNTIVLLDNCTFHYATYGVRDNAGVFIRGVKWDPPYVQNQTEFLASVRNFFLRVRQIDPKIRIICNTDAAADPAEFAATHENLDGISIENMEYYYKGGDDWRRSALYNQYLNATWAAKAGKIGLMGWMNTPNDGKALRRAFVHYLLVRGDNFFFAPQFSYSTEIPPSQYAGMKSSLGVPTTATKVLQEPGRPRGYNLYSRETAGGIVYLNWTGAAKTIMLPAGRQYVNGSGQPITRITIADMAGDYVLFAGSGAPNRAPTITLTAPANGAIFIPPAPISMSASASDPDGSVVRVEFWQGPNKVGERNTAPYTLTLSGMEPGSYSGPWALTAKAFDNRGAVTTSNAVEFTVSSTANRPPVVKVTAPSSGAIVPSTFTMTVAASDADGSVARVEFWQGPNKLGERAAAPYSWTVHGAAAGVYSGQWGLSARAFDNAGASTTSNVVDVTVSSPVNRPPVVALTAPAKGATVSSTFTMTATASDPDGSVVRVEFWQGPKKLGERSAAPYTLTVRGLAAGTYRGTAALRAKAVDNRGSVTTSSAVEVTVR